MINLSQKDIFKALGVKEKTQKYGQIVDDRQKSDLNNNKAKLMKNKINMFHPMKGSNNPHLIEYKNQL